MTDEDGEGQNGARNAESIKHTEKIWDQVFEWIQVSWIAISLKTKTKKTQKHFEQ